MTYFIFLILKELEKAASSSLDLSASRVIKMALDLYSSGLISYPLAKADIYPEEFEFEHYIKQFTKPRSKWDG